MKRFLRFGGPFVGGCWVPAAVWFFALVAVLRAVGDESQIGTIAELGARLAAHVAEPRFHDARWGIWVASTETGAVLFATNDTSAFIPASNTKLFVAALALDCLGPGARCRTSVFADAPPDVAGELAQDLIVYGRGDPTFIASGAGRPGDSSVDLLADRIVAAGVRRVAGDLVADATYFRGPTVGASWEPEDLAYAYATEVTALVIDDNAVKLRVRPGLRNGVAAVVELERPMDGLAIVNDVLTGAAQRRTQLRFMRRAGTSQIEVAGEISVGAPSATEALSLPRPVQWFGECLHRTLLRRGVRVSGQVRLADAGPGSLADRPSGWVELAAVDSPTLEERLPRMLKPSQNLHAELLLREVGRAGQAGHDSGQSVGGGKETNALESGLRAMREYLPAIGIPTNQFHFEDGSGLSRNNRVTPSAVGRLLQAMAGNRNGGVFRESLPLAGVEGTLANRFNHTPAERKARAKTGQLRGVAALSGYVTTAVGEQLAFVVMLNDYLPARGRPPARVEVDLALDLLAQLSSRTSPSREPSATPDPAAKAR